ncbi:MAG: NAD-dependent epimerase/dehydratase family protein [Patescibacteria group bacterium]|nr:NAD-dependent epimerase/dehydratase family protein [Patescibacteria group bacterium]MCP6727501.1 NAD-dependent epimerase/dehydratase family protein [Patescibacteria group bacterium]
MSKALVTGGAGFIGSHLSDKLINLGFEVTIVDDLSTGSLENIPSVARFEDLDVNGEGAKEKLIELAKDTDYIFHLAAIPRTQYCVENPIECHHANVTGTLNVLEAAVKNKVKKFILSSSCGIYGPQEKLPIDENAPINMGTPYSVQKYMQELYVGLYNELYNVPAVMLRYFNVYGTKRQTEKGSYPNVLAAFSKQKKEHGKIYVTGDGEQSRDMIHVFDVVDANITAMYSDLKDCEAFNIGTGKAASINEMAKYFECPIEYIEPRPGEAKHLYSDTSKAEKLLDWKAKISFEEGMRGYINDTTK